MGLLDKIVEQDEQGRILLEILKGKTFFREMELRALFNEYKDYRNETARKNYIRTAAFRLRKQFEKILRSLSLIEELSNLKPNLKLEDYDWPVRKVIEYINGLYLMLEVEVLARAEETKELSIDDIIHNTVFWYMLMVKRIAEQIESSEIRKTQEKWAKQVVELSSMEELVLMVNSYIHLLHEKAKKENSDLGLIWSQPPFFDIIEEPDEKQTETEEELIA